MTNNYNTAPSLKAAMDGTWVCTTCGTSCIDTWQCEARLAYKRVCEHQARLDACDDARKAAKAVALVAREAAEAAARDAAWAASWSDLDCEIQF